jgi:hypothetical protein
MPDPGELTTAERPTPTPTTRAGTASASRYRALYGRLDAETATVRGELLRVDAKANSLLAIAGVLLAGGLTVLGSGKLPAPAAVIGWVAVTVVGAAVVLLAAAIRPNLGGDFGFVCWARMSGGRQVLDDLIGERSTVNPLERMAGDLHWLSRALHGKYVAIRRSVTLLVAGLGIGAAAAAVSMWAR